MADTKETVRTDVEINARAALQQLREMSRDASNAEEAIAKFSSFLLTNSKKWQVPIKQLREEFRALNAELAKNKQQTLFGNFGNKKIFGGEEGFTRAAQAAGRFQVAQNGVVTSINRGNKSLDEADRRARGYAHGIDVVRTALGTLTAVGIFGIIQFITDSFQKATEAAKNFELALYNITNAERIISQQGIDITPQDLTDIITKLQEFNPTISRIDATNAVSQIAIFTKSLGFTKEQIEQLAMATAVLAVKNKAAGLSFQQVFDQLKTGLLTGTTKGITDLGVNINAGATKLEAMRLAGAKTEAQFDALNDAVKEQYQAQAILAIVYGQTTQEAESINDFLDTNTAKIEINKAAWEDLLGTIGSTLNNLIPDVSGFLNSLQEALEVGRVKKLFQTGLKEVFKTEGPGGVQFKDTIINWKLYFGVKLAQEEYDRLKEVLQKLSPEEIRRLFPDPSAIKDRFARELIESLIPSEDTVTGAVSNATAAISEGAQQLAKATQESEEKIQDIMQDSADKKAQIDQDYREKIEDANRDHAEKMEDIARDVARKQEDALRNYNEKVEDINRDANEKIAEAQADAQQKELDREAEFQNKLRELRERFLFDLEDALRERDARQVLRLIREYNFDKKNLEEKHKLERQDAKKDLAEKLADIERERQLKLEAAKRELAEKQAEIKIWQDREIADAQRALSRKLEDARRWHERELAENRQYLQRKLQDLAAAIAQEYQLTAAGAAAIQSLLNGYMGAGGIGALGGLSSGGTTSGGFTTFSPNGTPTYNPYDVRARFAEGGSFVATRPSKLLVAENQPEMVTVSPIGRVGNNQNKVFGDIGGGQQNSLDLRIQLTEGLVAEIVDSSLDSVAAHIEKINREK